MLRRSAKKAPQQILVQKTKKRRSRLSQTNEPDKMSSTYCANCTTPVNKNSFCGKCGAKIGLPGAFSELASELAARHVECSPDCDYVADLYEAHDSTCPASDNYQPPTGTKPSVLLVPRCSPWCNYQGDANDHDVHDSTCLLANRSESPRHDAQQ